jgi:AraC-like DNA-binding protein
MKIYIKNMVCIRCQMAVKNELEKLGLHQTKIELGEAEIMEDLSIEQRGNLSISLKNIGLELMDDRKNILADRVKTAIIDLVHYTDHQIKINLAAYLSEKVYHNYAFLCKLFSEVNDTTIEKFYLSQKLEKVKELLVYEELNLTDIAYKLDYSSVAHLSNQFKKMTGLTPSQFRNLKQNRRLVLADT